MLSSFVANSQNKIVCIKKSYSSYGQKRIQMSNNITSINVVSTLTQQDIDPTRITSLAIGSNVKTLLPSCFINCSNLVNVTTKPNLKDIQDEAFKNCTSLKNVGFLSKSNKDKVHNIGLSAFANTGLEDIYISLSGTATSTQIQPFAFANCRNLKSVTNVGSNYLADYEFANCSQLASVTMPNSHSFSGEYSFLNCTSLKDVKVPANTFMVNTGLFQGCSQLTSVEFQEPSLLKFTNCLGNDLFNGTAITSLTLPSSITSYTYISKNALRGMGQLKELHFNGMPMSAIAEQSQEESSEYKTGIIYSDIEGTTNYGVFKNGTYKYSDYFKDVSTSKCKQIVNYCKQNSIPLVVFHGNPKVSNCGLCQSFCENILCTSKFLDWVKSEDNKYIILDFGNGGYKISELSECYPSGNSFVLTLMYWKDEDGKVHKYGASNSAATFGNPANAIDKITSTFTGYDGSSTHIDTIVADIFASHCFGLNHDVTIFGNDGKAPVEYKDDGSGGGQQFIYTSDIQVDRNTVDDFRSGQWYYNARQLRAYADLTHVPVIVEFGSKNCGPCEDFHEQVFLQPSFQQLVASKKIFQCRNHVRDFYSDPGAYTAHEWALESEYPPGKMPILMLYWNQKNGATIDGTTWTDRIVRIYAHFNDKNDTTYPSCPLVYDLPTVNAWFESAMQQCSQYVPISQYDMPTITSYTNSYPRYKVYANQDNDDYGRYFPCYSSSPAKVYDTYEISVRNSSGVITKYNIAYNTTTNLPPDGTYQYFTMISTDQTYNTTYDISGIIFKVGKTRSSQYLNSDRYDYGAKDRSAYFGEISLTDDKIKMSNYSFRDDVYVRDANDDPTTTIDPAAFPSGVPVHNIKRTYYTQGFSRSSHDISKVEVYLSAEVTRKQDSDHSWYLEPSSTEYVLSSNFFYDSSSGSKIQWLSSFSNLEEP